MPPVDELTVRVWTDPVAPPDLPTRPLVATQQVGVVDVVTLVTEPAAWPHSLAVETSQLVSRLVSSVTFGTFPGLGITVALWNLCIFSPLGLIIRLIIFK